LRSIGDALPEGGVGEGRAQSTSATQQARQRSATTPMAMRVSRMDHVDTLRQTGASFGVAGGLDRLNVLPLEGAAHCDDAGASLRWAFIAGPAANGIARVDERRSRSTDLCGDSKG
jgi:hypothetical protein